MTEKDTPLDQPKKDATPASPAEEKKAVPPLNSGDNPKPVSAVEEETQKLIEKMLKNRKHAGEAAAPADKAGAAPLPPPAAQPDKPASGPAQSAPKADRADEEDPAWPRPAKSLDDSAPAAKAADSPTPVTPAPHVPTSPVEGGTARLNRPPAAPEAKAVPVDAEPSKLSKEEANAVARTTSVRRNVPGRGTQPVWKVIFQPMTASQVKELGVEVKGLLVVGRVEEGSPSKPDLDLNPFNAGDFGVSRMHVILTPSIEGPCITDMNSTNGTWINGLYLEPGRQYRLRTNDRVEIGSLKLLVKVIGPNDK